MLDIYLLLNNSPKMKKSQTAIEYLIILAVVVILGVVVSAITLLK